MGLKMSGAYWAIAAVGLLFSPAAHAGEAASGRDGTSRSIEFCQAFSWDAPVEQTLSVASVLRWRRAAQSVRQQQPIHLSVR
jgi:hypothetical protein